MAVMVNNLQEQVVVPAELFKLLEEISAFLLRMEGYPPESEVSIVLVDNSYIRELNLAYRGYDCPTDVLSFCLQNGMALQDDDHILGDVIISMEKAEEQARDFGHPFTREVAFLAVHGILHLTGYNHDTSESEMEMRERQNMALEHFQL